MSLISLLIALAAERYLSSPLWQFTYYYQSYVAFFNRLKIVGNTDNSEDSSTFAHVVFIALPVLACYFVLNLLGDGLLYLIASTLVLVVCFGCVKTRQCYKQYLLAAFRGEPTTCELHHLQLLQDKNLAGMGFGQSLVWLNYRYFIAVMFFFVLFGAPGALAYRLLTKLNENNNALCNDTPETQQESNNADEIIEAAESIEPVETTLSIDGSDDGSDERLNADANADANTHSSANKTETVNQLSQQILFWLDWLPVRAVAFCYMLVGHFSKAMPIWLENFFALEKCPHTILIDVAEKSEDFMVDAEDCTAEPCLLVRLAKRTLLLCLVILSLLILTGVLN